MPDDIDALLQRLIDGDPSAAVEILGGAGTASTPRLLVAAALIAEGPQAVLDRAAKNAVTTRDRQLVAVAAAHVYGNNDVLDVLVREHLSEFPDSIIAAWIAAHHAGPGQPTPLHPQE